ncbi:MAG: hypoxanthine phosphoribosyltransferase [Bacteroidia bacterium]|nr:hypoxanthine phosphoribosyltransferase [Bacteroidia bacterium]MBP9688884.1 hypoxanthine phosphoribosyltransferase [Bacteroidia bacterium]
MSIIKIHQRNFEPFITEKQINERLTAIAYQICAEYEGENPLFLAVLNGAFILAADLFRKITIQSEISFAKISSYQGTSTTNKISELIGFNEQIEGRNVIIIEDIIDTGLSMQYVLNQLQQKNPASVKVLTLLFKPKALLFDIIPDYVGFEIEPKFVLGYGLDYDGLGRNLPDIYVEVE